MSPILKINLRDTNSANTLALSENMQGAALMAASMAGFALNDTALKYGGSDLGLFQAIFLRGVFTVILIGTFAYVRGAFKELPPAKDLRRIGLRSLSEIGATLSFLTALFHMPLANITAILQVLPLSIALAAALFMNEPIGRKRIFAIVAGFIGVLIIVRPGASDFNSYALWGLVAVAFVTIRDLTVRQFSTKVSSLFVAFVASVVITLTGATGVAYSQTWTTPSINELAILAIAAAFIFVGYYCSVAAMRVGDVAVVSSYRYSVMVWAVALGWLVFGEIPDYWTIVGMSVILAAGLFTMWRERQAQRAFNRA